MASAGQGRTDGPSVGSVLVSSDEGSAVRIGGRTLLDVAIDTVEACPAVDVFVVAAFGAAPGPGAGATKFAGSVAGVDRRDVLRRAVDLLAAGVDVVVVHDVDHPVASPGLFETVVGEVGAADAAVPRLPAVETVKRVEDGTVVDTIPRGHLAVMQSPAAFRRSVLLEALGGRPGPPEEGELARVERMGGRVATVPGDRWNVRVGGTEDAGIAEAVLRARRGADGR